MKNALISPNESVRYIAGWIVGTDPLEPIYEILPNADRVSEVYDEVFEVAAPLFWVVCEDSVVADVWYYDSITGQIKEIPIALSP